MPTDEVLRGPDGDEIASRYLAALRARGVMCSATLDKLVAWLARPTPATTP